MGLLDLFKPGNKKETMKEKLGQGALIVDVRSRGEFQGGHVEGAENIPLNELLDQAKLEELSPDALKELRSKFEQPWNRWHIQRTVASFISFSLLLTGMIYSR